MLLAFEREWERGTERKREDGNGNREKEGGTEEWRDNSKRRDVVEIVHLTERRHGRMQSIF